MSPTIILIILNVGASFYAWSNENIYGKWMMNPYRIHHDNQYYRFITSGFIHGDWMHLFFNMFAFYSFGEALEYYLDIYEGATSQLYFYGIYIVALIVSDIPTYLKNKDNENYNSLGASGAVAAIIFACIIINPLSEIYIYFIKIPGFIFGFIYLAYSYYSGKKSLGGINHDAHLYGAIFGVISILIIHPPFLYTFIEQISSWRLF
jgi:membrane associated rhomboid family serine protease